MPPGCSRPESGAHRGSRQLGHPRTHNGRMALPNTSIEHMISTWGQTGPTWLQMPLSGFRLSYSSLRVRPAITVICGIIVALGGSEL